MLDSSSFQTQFNVSRETIDRFLAYEELLKKWTVKINLVSKSTLQDVWSRHFWDSAQVFSELTPGSANIADFGSGGGLPGLVIAILCKESSPDSVVTLVESDVRKAAFLSTVARELNLSVVVRSDRIENVPELRADVVTARALASLDKLFPLAQQHLKPDGYCLFPKGKTYQEEVAVARAAWNFEIETKESQTQPGAALLKVTNLRAKC